MATAEFSKSNQALVEQSNSLKIQNFEQTFFHLLFTHNQIVNAIDLTIRDVVKTGRDCFSEFYVTLHGISRMNVEKSDYTDELEFAKEVYKQHYKRFQGDTGHYFLFLYNMVKFVDEKCENADPKFYTNLIRAQLSHDELGLLFYHCISVVGENKFKTLIEKYGFFKHLPTDTLINEDHLSFYEKNAYE